MILTGTEIAKQVKEGHIVITPFCEEQVNPNSYNYRITDTIVCFEARGLKKKVCNVVCIPRSGFVLTPHRVYLSNTYEVLGSEQYAMSLIGKSSLGRLGLFLQVAANLGHTGSVHQWTLELVAAQPLILYPFMIIGQISFWRNNGSLDLYREGYSRFNHPQLSKYETNCHDPHRN